MAEVWNGREAPQLAIYVQEYLRAVGVQMEVVMLEEALMWNKLTAGDFEALLFRHQPGPEAQWRDFGRENRIGYQSAAAFEVIDRIMATADPDETILSRAFLSRYERGADAEDEAGLRDVSLERGRDFADEWEEVEPGAIERKLD